MQRWNATWYYFDAPSTRTKVAIIFLGILGLLCVVSIFSNITEISLLQRIERGEIVSLAEAASNDNRQAAVAIVYLLCYIATVIVFLFWVHRVSRNLRGLGVEHQRFSPCWAIGGWFIPIFHLFRPYQVIKEIWQESQPHDFSHRLSPLLGPWWAAFLISGWLGNATLTIFWDADTAKEFIIADWLAVASDVITLIAGVLVVVLMLQISANQQRKHAILSESASRGEGGDYLYGDLPPQRH